MIRSGTSAGSSTRGLRTRTGAFNPTNCATPKAVIAQPTAGFSTVTTTTASVSARRGFSSIAPASASSTSSSSTVPSSSTLGNFVGSIRQAATSRSHPVARVTATRSPFSTTSAQKKAKRGGGIQKQSPQKHHQQPLAVQGEKIYRKEGSKIVPVDSPMDAVQVPVSGIFSQVAASSSSSPTVSAKAATAGEKELPTSKEPTSNKPSLTLRDVFPPDELLEQLLKRDYPRMSASELKEMFEPLLDVYHLPESDPKRIQAERALMSTCNQKSFRPASVGFWAIKYTRFGAPFAAAVLKLATEGGDFDARYSYAVLLYRGVEGVPAQPLKARKILEAMGAPSPHRKSYAPAQATLAAIYARDDKDYTKAKQYYELAGRQGMAEAWVALGRMYLSGEITFNKAEAKKCFQLAMGSEKDQAEAYFMMGVLEMREEPPNIKEAFQHYQRAASKGLPEAQFNIGNAYLHGVGVAKNEAMALEYWKMAGQQGFGLAQLNLGAYYFQDKLEQPAPAPASTGGEGPSSLSSSPASPSASSSASLASASTSPPAASVLQPHVLGPLPSPAQLPERDLSKRDLDQALKWFTLASRRPGELGAEGARLKAKVEEAIRRGEGANRNSRMCSIM
ncbi:hypothetical protein DFQ26_004591 [Actinomortierella ambigua]|nr:hypothetical protein DFQ26_004591 [Actinomortierella ambigua]